MLLPCLGYLDLDAHDMKWKASIRINIKLFLVMYGQTDAVEGGDNHLDRAMKFYHFKDGRNEYGD